MLEEGVVKVEEGNCSQDNLRLERARSDTPRHMGIQEFRRFKHAPGNREDIARRGTLTQLHQRVVIGRTKIYKDKQHMQRI